jgi:HEPN domain-containing protein
MSRQSSHTSDSKRYYDWLYHAYQDILSGHMLIDDPRLAEQAVFHCQQAIEKSLKAFLLYKTHKLFDGHNLAWLCKQAALLDSGFTPWLSRCAALNRFYIETRYPADIPAEMPVSAAKEILSDTDDIMEYVCDALKFDFASYHKRIKK